MASPIPTQLSPGVKVSEIDLSQFVQPEAFNRGGMAGIFNWGPGLVATTVSTESQLAEIFGKPTLDQFDTAGNSDFLAASNFLRYSSNLRLVRLVQDGDYNAVSADPGITWIGSVTHATIENEDAFRQLGGFSGNNGIEPVSFFKARYPGNFGNALGVIVFDGITSENLNVTIPGGYRDYTLNGGYNQSTMIGITSGTVGVTFQASVLELDPISKQNVVRIVEGAEGGLTFAQLNWVSVNLVSPADISNFVPNFMSNGKFLYATGTSSENRTLMENGLNPDRNNVNCFALSPPFDTRETNPFVEYGIASNPEWRASLIRRDNDNSFQFVFWDFDSSNALVRFRPGATANFVGMGDKEIFAVLPIEFNEAQMPSAFQATGSIFNFAGNNTEIVAKLGGYYTGLPVPSNVTQIIENRLIRYLTVWSGVKNLMEVGTLNGRGWVNLIGGGMTGPKTMKKFVDGVQSNVTVNFDPNSGITGIKNNFANGIVQLGDFNGSIITERPENYESTVIFDKTPGTSEYAATVGGSNDEISIAVIDFEGKFGPRGSILEKFELLSKAVDAKNLNGESIFYKDYINRNSRYIYCTKPFGFTGGGNENSIATTAFGDIYTRYRPDADGVTFNRTGFYETILSLGESSINAASSSELIDGYALFADDDNAVDVLFLPESSLDDDNDTNPTLIEQSIYDAVIEPRKDTLFVVPTPAPASSTQHTATSASKTINFRKNNLTLPSNSYTVLVAGRKLFFDTFNNQIRKISLSSDVAGILCAQEIPWESPAGFARGNLKNAIRLETKFTKVDRDELYKNQINFFTEFNDGTGTVLFGDKTLLVKPSAFDRINVRRVFIALEKAIAKAAKYSLFEFNDEFTRAQFRDLITPYLRSVVAQRGISDFKIVCDESNNTAQVIDRNQFVADIYIKPLKSINFIQLNFIAARSDFNLTVIE